MPATARGQRYGELAQAALAGERIGSSAAGEQPKFTACVADADGSQRHVIVKFSEPVDGNPAARHWHDCADVSARMMMHEPGPVRLRRHPHHPRNLR
jgi:hypothetical protein